MATKKSTAKKTPAKKTSTRKTSTRKAAAKKVEAPVVEATNEEQEAAAIIEQAAKEEIPDGYQPHANDDVMEEQTAEDTVAEAMREDLGDNRSVAEIVNDDADPFPALLRCNDANIVAMASRLLGFRDKILDRSIDARVRITFVRSLYNEIVRVMNNSKDFKSEFMVLFTFFRVNIDTVFNQSTVFELVHFWTNDNRNRFTYTIFVTAMTGIISAKDVAKGLKRVDPDVLFDKNTTAFNDAAKKNFITFFKL